MGKTDRETWGRTVSRRKEQDVQRHRDMKLVSVEYLFCVRPSQGQNLQINHSLIGREGLGV